MAILILSAGVMAWVFLNLENLGTPLRPINIACVGDSITELTNYPANLQALLGAGYRVESFGVTGSTVLLNTDKPYLNQSAFQQARAFLPNVVVIMLGTNDARINTYRYNKSQQESFWL